MLRKVIASVLLLLSALPFTAPFATVDMPTLLGARSSATPEQTLLTPSVEDGSHALVAPAARARVRFRSVLRLETHFGTTDGALPISGTDRTPVVAHRHTGRLSLTALRI
jgi:hypothetical protein